MKKIVTMAVFHALRNKSYMIHASITNHCNESRTHSHCHRIIVHIRFVRETSVSKGMNATQLLPPLFTSSIHTHPTA